jgi:hypothetical protein
LVVFSFGDEGVYYAGFLDQIVGVPDWLCAPEGVAEFYPDKPENE